MEKQLLLVANAHMHWDPEYCDVKLVQTMMFLSEVKNIVDKATRSLKLSSVSGETNSIPLVLCADLNSLPDSGESLTRTSPANCLSLCDLPCNYPCNLQKLSVIGMYQSVAHFDLFQTNVTQMRYRE